MTRTSGISVVSDVDAAVLTQSNQDCISPASLSLWLGKGVVVLSMEGRSEGSESVWSAAASTRNVRPISVACDKPALRPLPDMDTGGIRSWESPGRIESTLTSSRGKLGRWLKLLAPKVMDNLAAKAIREKK